VVEAGVLERVLPVMRPLEASDRTLEEMEGTAVTGQTISVRTMVLVTTTVWRASVGKFESSSVFVGQSMTSGAQEVMVRTSVVAMVRVVIPPAVPFVGKGATLVMRDSSADETPVERRTPVEVASTPVERSTVEEAASRVASEDTASAELETIAVVFWRLQYMLYLGWEARALVRAAKRPRARVAVFILNVVC